MEEAKKNGWIRLYRKLLEDSLWKTSTPEQKVLMITSLLMVNHKEKEWAWKGNKFKVPVGGMITSLESIKKNAGKKISFQKIRTFLEKFQKYGFLTNETTKTGRLIIVRKFSQYQSIKRKNNKGINKQVTNNQQTGNKQVTPNKNDKNDKNEKKDKKRYIYSRLINDIVSYLNSKTNKNFKTTTTKTISLIKARLNEGFNIDDFKKVIDIKTAKWKSDPKMCDFLRPETLFGTKFESYLQEKLGSDWENWEKGK